MSSTSNLPGLNRRAFVAAAASAADFACRRLPSMQAMARLGRYPRQNPRPTRSSGFRAARRITSRPSRSSSEKWRAPRRRARKAAGRRRRRCRCREAKWPGPPPGRGACISSAAMAKARRPRLPSCLRPDGRPLVQCRAIAARRQPRRRRGGCRPGLCARRLHRTEPQSGSERVCLRRGGRQVDGDRAVAASARRGRGRGARRQDPSDRRRRSARPTSAPASAGTRSTIRRPTNGKSARRSRRRATMSERRP